MSVQWRPVLAQLQAALQSSSPALPLAQSAEGYQLLSSLLTSGSRYDVAADDGAFNLSPFSQTVNRYAAQAAPYFVELDRLLRLVFNTYSTSSAMTPAVALAFNVVTQAQANAWSLSGTSPSFSAPTALAFDYTGGNFTTLSGRSSGASTLLAGNTPASLQLGLLVAIAENAWNNGIWYDTDNLSQGEFINPPVNPSTSAETSSARVTATVNIAIGNAQAWLSALGAT